MISKQQCLEIVPINMNYQSIIMVATGLLDYADKQFVFQTYSCGCGPQPAIRGAYLTEIIPWQASGLCAFFAAADNDKDRALAKQTVMDSVYSVRLPGNDGEKAEITAALRSHFGANKEISFF